MTQVIQAIYENGVFRPLEKLELGDRQQVQITVESRPPDGDRSAEGLADPLEGIRMATGISDLAEHFDDYRLGRRKA